VTYVDTSVLVSLYVSDANSQKADAWRKANPAPIDFTSLHRIELRNALSLAVFQQRITPAQSAAAWTQVQEDLNALVLVAKADAWDKLIAEAESLASNQTPTLGTRTLDVLHVAAARVTGATEFCTFDGKQGKLAQAIGLQLRP
jgi:predicted nucleic acid-binding protein